MSAVDRPDSESGRTTATSSRRRDLLLLLLALGMGLAGAGLMGRAVAKQAHAPPAEPTARPVELRTLDLEEVRDHVLLDGILDPLDQVALAFQVPGRVAETHVREGASVAAGEVLARLEDGEYQAALRLARAHVEAAEARLDEALSGPRKQEVRRLEEERQAARAAHELTRTEYARAERLKARQALTASEHDRLRSALDGAAARLQAAEAALDQALEGARRERIQLARAELEAARATATKAALDLEATALRAPFAGVVAARPLVAGSYVLPGAPVVQLVVVDVLEARAGVPERYLEQFRPGAPVLVLAGDRRIPGSVLSLAPVVDHRTRTFSARIRVENSDQALRVGHSVQVVAEEAPRRALTLPPRAVLPTPGGKVAVFVAEAQGRGQDRDGPLRYQVRRREVRATWMKDGRVEVVEGLAPGTTVVVSGAAWLLEGDPVVALATAAEARR